MQLLKGNALVTKPFLRNDLDKYAHSKIFLLRNYGPNKFRRVKRQQVFENFSYIK